MRPWLRVGGAVLLAVGTVAASAAGGWYARGRGDAPRETVEDRNRDGRPDRWVTRDERGRLARVREDDNHDGFAERSKIYVDGRLNRVDHDTDGDRAYDSTDQLGADGQVLMTLTDRNWNSLPERWVQFNAQHQVASEWVDANEDSEPERYRSFDAAGRLVDEGIDADGDGLYELSRTFNVRWPAGSHALRIERDDDHDGIYERRETYTREGVLRTVNDDSDRDGTRDRITLYAPDGAVRKEGRDRDGDGFYETWRFPQAGAPARVAWDDDEDYDIDRWEAPGAPAGWCESRCRVAPARAMIPDG